MSSVDLSRDRQTTLCTSLCQAFAQARHEEADNIRFLQSSLLGQTCGLPPNKNHGGKALCCSTISLSLPRCHLHNLHTSHKKSDPPAHSRRRESTFLLHLHGNPDWQQGPASTTLSSPYDVLLTYTPAARNANPAQSCPCPTTTTTKPCSICINHTCIPDRHQPTSCEPYQW